MSLSNSVFFILHFSDKIMTFYYSQIFAGALAMAFAAPQQYASQQYQTTPATILQQDTVVNPDGTYQYR